MRPVSGTSKLISPGSGCGLIQTTQLLKYEVKMTVIKKKPSYKACYALDYPNLQAKCLASLPSDRGCRAQNLYNEVRSTAETNWLENNFLSPSFSEHSLWAVKKRG